MENIQKMTVTELCSEIASKSKHSEIHVDNGKDSSGIIQQMDEIIQYAHAVKSILKSTDEHHNYSELTMSVIPESKPRKLQPGEILAADIIDSEEWKSENTDLSSCEVCRITEIGYMKMKDQGLRCSNPECGKSLHGSVMTLVDETDLCIVGETNTADPNQIIRYIPILTCHHCNKRTGLMPIPIIYNANHDIFYTGGKNYLVHDKAVVPDKVVESIHQFIDRLKGGENNLSAEGLVTVIGYGLESYIAEKLVEHGLKY